MNLNKPNLFILGIAKSGTTTLADALCQHPNIFIPPTKEPTFFSSDINYSNGLDWYFKNYYSDTDKYLYKGDASPSYIYFGQKVVQRISTALPDSELKFIIVFRNPVDRAYSHYWHNVNRGLRENLSFEKALELEDERLKTQDKELNDLGRIRYAYFHAGLYADQMKVFLMQFSRKNFLLLLQEDLYNTRFHLTMSLIQNFLQIPILDIKHQHSNSSYRPRNRNFDRIVRKHSSIKDALKRVIPANTRTRFKSLLLKINSASVNYPLMDPSTRKILLEKFTPSIKEFEKMIGRDLSHWLV